MEYLETQPGSPMKYTGAVAQGYDAKREQSEKWLVEQRIIEAMLGELPRGSTVLDVPCGTGRFFNFYQRQGFLCYGLDISQDMLQIASQKIGIPGQFRLAAGDVREGTKLPDRTVTAAVMCRLTRWLSPQECQLVFRELQRVTQDRIILTARVANHPHMRPAELFENALLPGWHLARNERGYMDDYRILMFQHGVQKVAEQKSDTDSFTMPSYKG